MRNNNCKTCEYYLHEEVEIEFYDTKTKYEGMCKRYPKNEPKNEDDGCGEYMLERKSR